MSELLPCPSTIPPAQPSKVVALLREAAEHLRGRKMSQLARGPEKLLAAIDAELGEARS